MDLSDFQVRMVNSFNAVKCPPTAIYIPNFITSEDEHRVFSQIDRTPKPKWTQLLNRRLINYGGIPHPNGMLAERIPEWLQVYVDKINNLNIFESRKANHVLINEYLPGQGIMPHTDGPLFYPVISTITCGSHTVLDFIEREKDASSNLHSLGFARKVIFKILLEPRSLLILKDSLYTDYLHSINEVKQDVLCDRICNFKSCETVHKIGDILQRGTRISLTIRHVPKTTKMKLKF